MEAKIIEKITRYLELSQQFTKSENEVFPKPLTVQDYKDSNSWVCVSNVNINQPKPKSRAEKILEEAHLKAKKSDEYDEYLTLWSELSQYFQALNKINK